MHDISKAFNKLWHIGLIYKMQKININQNLIEISLKIILITENSLLELIIAHYLHQELLRLEYHKGVF